MIKKTILALSIVSLLIAGEVNSGTLFSAPVEPVWVSIKGIEKATLLSELYGAMYLQTYQIRVEDARSLIQRRMAARQSLYFDTIFEKRLQVDISGEVMDVSRYNRLAKKPGLAQIVIRSIRKEMAR